MAYVRIFFVVALVLFVGYSGLSKIIIEELNKHYRTYKKVDTLYYEELQDLVSRISIDPVFLWEATKLILKIEEEGRNTKL